MTENIERALGRMEGKLDMLLRDGTKRDHETRLRSLERWRWYLAGGFGVLVSVVALIGGVIHALK